MTYPSLIIFDVDGVLVDVRGSFHRTVLQTVKFFTGKPVTEAELHRWKNRSGFNDDWVLSTAWVQSLGGKHEYDEVKQKFVELYWSPDGKGNVVREKWLLSRARLSALAKHAELAIFTGRTSRELDYTLDRCKVREFFKAIVTVEDVSKPKPDPEGLIKLSKGRAPETCLYVGDNVDDARAAQCARVPFVGILPADKSERPARLALLREYGARAILLHIRELDDWLIRHSRSAERQSRRRRRA
jgi:HAD superfamily hydrolase (TIGR01548 family)